MKSYSRISFLLSMSFVFNILSFDSNVYAGKNKETEGFNELFQSQNEARDQYHEIVNLFDIRYSKKEDKFLKESRKKFQGDNALDPIPRVLTSTEYEVLKKGVHQRSRAIQKFLEDYYSGQMSYHTAHVVPQDTVARIIARNGDSAYFGKIDPSTISFFYGPDIIRDAEGNWRVIEDNIGFIGGLGDLELAQKLIFSAYPELKSFYEPRIASEFYDRVAQSYIERAQKFGGKAILYMIPEYSADNEDERIAEIFERRGIETITPESVKRLMIKEDGVYLRYRGNERAPLEKVGFIVLNGEHSWVDPSHSASKVRTIIETASEYLRDVKTPTKIKDKLLNLIAKTDKSTYLPNLEKVKEVIKKHDYEVDKKIKNQNKGLLDAVLANQVGINYTPGIDFVGDKEMYIYIEDLIRFYLNEEPIIKNIESGKFTKGVTTQLDSEKINTIFAQLKTFVIKKVDGRGGDSVWIGAKLTSSEIQSVRKSIEANPDVFIWQKYTPLSVSGQNIVDIRVISDVNPTETIVTETPWGRAIPINGNGKVNISDQGREVAVVVVNKVPSQFICRRIFTTN